MGRQEIEQANLKIYDFEEGGIHNRFVRGEYDRAMVRFKIGLVKSVFQDTAGKPVLNLGADAAGIFETLCDIGNIGISVDLAPKKLKGNKQLGKGLFVNARAQELPFSDNSVYGVCAFDIIEHLVPEDSSKMLQEIFRVLVPGQKVVLTTTNTNCFARRTRRLIQPDRAISRIDHGNEMAYSDIVSLFERCGFSDLQTRGISIIPGLSKIQRFLPPIKGIYRFDQNKAENHPEISAEVLFIATKPY